MVNIIVCDDEAVFLDIVSDEVSKVMSKHNLEYQCIKFKSSCDFVELIDKGDTEKNIFPTENAITFVLCLKTAQFKAVSSYAPNCC